MNRFSSCSMKRIILTILFAFSIHPVSAQEKPALIPEETLRKVLAFEEGATLKLAACQEKSHPTCTYVWGGPSEKDLARTNAGLKPEGSSLTTIFVKARKPSDFDRVLATYSDTEDLQGLGVRSVWSPGRHQLSLITEDNLIVHVNISDKNNENSKTAATEIAKHILAAD